VCDKGRGTRCSGSEQESSNGKQQLDAAITLPSAARLATTVLLDPDLFVGWVSSI